MFYLVTADYSQKGGFSDSSKELFKSYKGEKKVIIGMKNLVRLLDFHFQPRWNNRDHIYSLTLNR